LIKGKKKVVSSKEQGARREKGKRISNIEQGISNDEVRNAGSPITTFRDSDLVRRGELEDLIIRTVEQ
jgi:hypothetical protein